MKTIKLFHVILGVIPFTWLISFFSILIIGTIHFGSIPRYGNIEDPHSLGLDWIDYIEGTLFILSFYHSFYGQYFLPFYFLIKKL